VNGRTAGVSPVPLEARPYQGRRAGVVSRGLASIIDAIVVVALLVTAYLGLNLARFLLHPRRFEFVSPSYLWMVNVALAATIVYLTGAWAMAGRTYGGHVMGLRLVNRRGKSPGWLVAILRATFCVVLPVGLLWCASQSRRSIQDLVLGTYTLYDWLPGHTEALSP